MAKKEIGRPQTAHIAPFGLRLQPELKERIEKAASASGRSMNAEIVARLEVSYKQPPASEVLDMIVAMRHDAADAELDRHMLVMMVNELALYVKAFSQTLLSSAGEPLSDYVKGKIAEWSRESEVLVSKAAEMLHTDLGSAVAKFEETGKSYMDRIQRVQAEAETLMSSASKANREAMAAARIGTPADAKIVGRNDLEQARPSVLPKPRRGAKK